MLGDLSVHKSETPRKAGVTVGRELGARKVWNGLPLDTRLLSRWNSPAFCSRCEAIPAAGGSRRDGKTRSDGIGQCQPGHQCVPERVEDIEKGSLREPTGLPSLLQIPSEEPVQEGFRKIRIVGDLFVELEIRVELS